MIARNAERARLDERRRFDIRAVGLALLLAAFSACSDKPEDSSKALAIINGKEITASEFDLRWSQLPEFARKTYAGPDGRKKFLEELITRELLLQEAKKRGLDRDRALIERVERFKERSVLDNLMREEVDSRITVTVEEMKAYYAANPASYTSPDELRASHILVKTEEDALDAKKRLDQGEDFAALARKVSLDLATRFKGGELGPIKKGQTVPQFEKTLLALKVGEISNPVVTQFGYHIVKLNDRTAGAPLSFEDAKDQVKEQILIEKKRKRFDELVASLRAKAKLRVADVPIPVSEVPAAGAAVGSN
jgi:peptidyl-prolyl cis-trans isomerase C